MALCFLVLRGVAGDATLLHRTITSYVRVGEASFRLEKYTYREQ